MYSLSGQALFFARDWKNNHENDGSFPQEEIWDAFIHYMERLYLPYDVEEHRQGKFLSLEQNEPVRIYEKKVRRYARDANYDEDGENAKMVFFNGLHNRLRKVVVLYYGQNSISRLVELAHEVEIQENIEYKSNVVSSYRNKNRSSKIGKRRQRSSRSGRITRAK